MRTRRNPTLWLAAILALSTACGDDKDDTNDTDGGNTGGNTAGNTGDDAGNNGDDAGGNSGDFGAACKGRYDGFKGSDLKENLAGEGECLTDKEVLQICKIDPSIAAAMEGATCFIGGKTGDALRTCTVDGDETLAVDGLRKTATDLSDGCLDCYADSVACSAEKGCGPVCAGNPTGDACVKCREDNGCTPTFYACSGLPRAEDL